MEIDQIHEQNNAVMKDMGGATSLLNILEHSFDSLAHQQGVKDGDYEWIESAYDDKTF